jgi:hypothetical protein
MLKRQICDIPWFVCTFLVEGNAKYQSEVSENKDVIFFIQVHGPPEIYPRTSKGSVDPRLRAPALDQPVRPCALMLSVSLIGLVSFSENNKIESTIPIWEKNVENILTWMSLSGECKYVHNEEFPKRHSSPNTVSVTSSGMLIWAGLIART